MKDCIPDAWIKSYVDQLIKVAGDLNNGPMRTMTLHRADVIMDMVKAYRESQKGNVNG